MTILLVVIFSKVESVAPKVSTPQIHAAYVSREQVNQVDLTKEAIDGDCGVLLQIGNDHRAYTTLSEPDRHPDRSEIPPDRARAMHLLGRKKGERFVFDKDGFGNVIECIQIEVQSKYVCSFQESLEKFPTNLPRDRTLKKSKALTRNFGREYFDSLTNNRMPFAGEPCVLQARFNQSG